VLCQYSLVCTTDLGNLPAVQVCTAKTAPCSPKPIQIPDPLPLGGPNPYPYLLSRRFFRGVLYPTVTISGSAIRATVWMVTSRHSTGNRKILTLVRHCLCSMYWLPLLSKQTEIHFLPYPENKHQQGINDCWSGILCNLSGNRFQMVINKALAACIGNRESDLLTAQF